MECAKKGLNKLKGDQELRLISETLKFDSVEMFSLELIEHHIRQGAPLVHTILKDLTSGTNSKNLHAVIPIIGSMLLNCYSRNANYLQVMMGIYLYGTSVSRKTVQVFSKAGLSSSHTSIWRSLNSLNKDAEKRVREAVRTRPWLILYDNINIHNTKSDQRSDRLDSFDNGFAATIVICEDIGKLNPEKEVYKKLRLDDLLPNSKNHEHFKKVCGYHLTDVLSRYHEGHYTTSQAPIKDPLPLQKTETYLLPAMKIDQSAVEGNKDILETIIKKVLGLPEECFEDGLKIIIAGDQLTVARVRSVQYQRADDISAYSRFEWAVPLMQLFHLKMLMSTTILRNYYGKLSIPGTLSYYAAKLKRRRVDLKNPEFHAVDELIRQVFDATVLKAWESVLETKDLSAFAQNLDEDTKSSKISHGLDAIINDYVLVKEVRELLGTASRNAALFIRDMILYRELAESIKVGDAGRIEEVLKWITVLFQAGCATNYANELLHLHCWIHYGGPKEAKNALLSSLLINDYGEPRRWIPGDLFQEHNNHLIKKFWSGKGSNASWELLNKVSPSIRAFSRISLQFEKQFKVTNNNSYHRSVDSEKDVNRIRSWLGEIGIFGQEVSDDTGVEPVMDFIDEGIKDLIRGNRIRLFREKGAASGQPGGESIAAGMGNLDLDNEAEDEVEYQADNDTDNNLDADSDVIVDVDFDYDQYSDDAADAKSEASVGSIELMEQ
ncbi:hypothetical protein BGX26_004888 [Mortierella sp. AD094]|nr:hypothetical protein BGX26_004888 [Mortierella sp. AD094]